MFYNIYHGNNLCHPRYYRIFAISLLVVICVFEMEICMNSSWTLTYFSFLSRYLYHIMLVMIRHMTFLIEINAICCLSLLVDVLYYLYLMLFLQVSRITIDVVICCIVYYAVTFIILSIIPFLDPEWIRWNKGHWIRDNSIKIFIWILPFSAVPAILVCNFFYDWFLSSSLTSLYFCPFPVLFYLTSLEFGLRGKRYVWCY